MDLSKRPTHSIQSGRPLLMTVGVLALINLRGCRCPGSIPMSHPIYLD